MQKCLSMPAEKGGDTVLQVWDAAVPAEQRVRFIISDSSGVASGSDATGNYSASGNRRIDVLSPGDRLIARCAISETGVQSPEWKVKDGELRRKLAAQLDAIIASI